MKIFIKQNNKSGWNVDNNREKLMFDKIIENSNSLISHDIILNLY